MPMNANATCWRSGVRACVLRRQSESAAQRRAERSGAELAALQERCAALSAELARAAKSTEEREARLRSGAGAQGA
jgi:hypothetical protein